MKRILFVDDEPRVLNGLRQLLAHMEKEWEMVFVESGAQALEAMRPAPFDLVVADMRMPGMTGAELLNEVMLHHPRTVRVIVSSPADNGLILKCVGSTHQFLCKPCNPDLLKALVERAAALETTLQSERLRTLASRMQELPSLPSLYTKIVKMLESADVGLDEVGSVVGQDIGITAKLLKLVNSAFFGLHRDIADAQEAVSFLGVDTIKSLVLGVQTFDQFASVKVPGFSLEELWRHSALTAVAARTIAKAAYVDAHLVDESFTAGLLHDTGKLIFACHFGPSFAASLILARQQGLSQSAAERRVFAASHAEVGGYLLGLWGLPVPVVEAITLHHTPSYSPNHSFSPLTAVHIGDVLAHEVAGRSNGSPDAQLDEEYLKGLGLGGRLREWRSLVREAEAA